MLVWIDYNQDNDFDDVGELAFVSTIGSTTAYTGSITIPLSAASGSTRMRVRLHDTHDGTAYINIFNDTPCGTASYGEVQDYTVNVSTGGDVPANDECSGAVAQAPGHRRQRGVQRQQHRCPGYRRAGLCQRVGVLHHHLLRLRHRELLRNALGLRELHHRHFGRVPRR